MSSFRHVLKNRNFLLLWVSQVISQLGDRLGQMALIGFMYLKAPGSTLGIAKILSFTIIPVFLIGPIAGVYVDRWDRRRTMYVCDGLRTLLVLAVPFFLFNSETLIPAYLLIFLVFSAGRFFVPAKLSIIPELVPAQDLLMANSLVHITGMIAAVLGFGVSGVIIEWLGPRSGLYLDALSFLVSAAMVFFITKRSKHSFDLRAMSKDIVEVIQKSVLQEVRDGIAYFVKQKEIRFAAGVIFALWSALGAVYVVIIVFVQTTLESATKDLGLLIMFLGLGLFFGSMVYGRFGRKLSQYKTIFASLVSSGIMLIVFALGIERSPSFTLAVFLAFLLGVVISPIMIASNTIIHKVSENGMMGKVFSSLEIVMHAAFLLFMFISGYAAKFVSEASILIVVGCVFGVLGFVNLIYHRRIPWLN